MALWKEIIGSSHHLETWQLLGLNEDDIVSHTLSLGANAAHWCESLNINEQLKSCSITSLS